MDLTLGQQKRKGVVTVAKSCELRLAWVDAATARRAVEAWHYSRSYPVSKAANIGIFEDGSLVGVVVFAHGGNYQAGSPFGLRIGEIVELVRVAMRPHKTAVSRCIAIALRMLKKSSPAVRLVVSYADPVQGHAGGIYKAGGWVFVGQTPASFEFRLKGQRLQKRAYTGGNFGSGRMQLPKGAEKVQVPGKLKFLMPLDPEIRALILPMAVPYLQSPSSMNHAPPDQGGDGGSGPTGGLQSSEGGNGPSD